MRRDPEIARYRLGRGGCAEEPMGWLAPRAEVPGGSDP